MSFQLSSEAAPKTRILYYHEPGTVSGQAKKVKAILAEDPPGEGTVWVDIYIDPGQAEVAEHLRNRMLENFRVLDKPLLTMFGFTVGIMKPPATRTATGCPVERLGDGVINMAHSALEKNGYTVFDAIPEQSSTVAAD